MLNKQKLQLVIKLYQLQLIMNGHETDAFRFELPLLKLITKNLKLITKTITKF